MIHPAGRKSRTIRARFFVITWCALLLIILDAGSATAQSLEARVSVLSLSPARVKVEGTRAEGAQAWSFRNIYASVIGLGERIENLSLKDKNGADVAVRKLAPGEYQAASALATAFSYELKLEPPQPATDAAYVSWLASERGFLMLGDLLPLRTKMEEARRSAIVRFTLPAGWSIASNEKKRADGQFEMVDAEQAVFFVGQDLRQRRERIGAMDFTFVAAGEWAFTDDDAAKMAANILKDYAEAVGTTARSSAVLMLSPFPRPVSAERWSAETRGGTVMLLSGRSPSKTAALAQLSVPLSHELFHLWVPNGLPGLEGNYDWFYEGFTMYQAMRAGLRLRLLTFQDYLNAMGRAYDIYRSARDGDKLSLLEASQQRWASATMLVYNKGMLVAFLYDLTLRQRSNGKRTLDDVYRELFRRYHATEQQRDGNAAVIAVLNSRTEMQDFTRRFVESAGTVDLASLIAPFGLRVERGGVRTHVAVSDSLTRSQRDLLREFGYNGEDRAMSKRARDEAKKRRIIEPR
jgi:predicted metalloprotease with PDZ domain